MVIFGLIIKILAGMVIGFIINKIGLLNDKSNSVLSRLILEITCPFMVFASIASLSGQNTVEKSSVYQVLLIGVIVYVVMTPLCYLIVKLMRVPQKSSGVFQCLLIFGNVGFLGFPIAESLYGAVGVFYMAILNIHFVLLMYTYGLWLVTRDADTAYKFSFKRLISPAIICILISLTLFLLDIRLPDLVIEPFSFIGGITSPLSLIVLGSSIASQNLKEVFRKWKLYILTAVRMLLFPFVGYFILKILIGPGLITNIFTFYLGMPSALVTSMFTMAYGGDQETATAGTAMMNVFCIVTIPLMFLMTEYL